MANLSKQDIVMLVAAAGILLWLTQSGSSSEDKAPEVEDPDFAEDNPGGGKRPQPDEPGPEEDGGQQQPGAEVPDGGLKGGGRGRSHGGGGAWPGDMDTDWDKRPPGAGGRSTAMPHNHATTDGGRDGQWAFSEIELSQRVEHTKARLRSMYTKLQQIQAQYAGQVQKVLDGKFADKPWQKLQEFERVRQAVATDRLEYEALGRKAGLSMSTGQPADYFMTNDKLTGALQRALERLGMYAKKRDSETERAMQHAKMVKREAARDRARMDSARKLRNQTAGKAMNRLRGQLTQAQRAAKTASAKSKAKIQDLQDQVSDLQDVAMAKAPALPTPPPPEDAFMTEGRFDGTDILSLGGGHTMSRPTNPTRAFDDWAATFSNQEHDMSSFDPGLGAVDNRTAAARMNELGEMMPPVHANPPVAKNTGKVQDAVAILNERASLQDQARTAPSNLDAIADRLQSLENRVSEVVTGTAVTGNEPTTLQANFNSAPPNPDRDAPERQADRRAQAKSAQINPRTDRVKPPAKVNVVVHPPLPAVANFNASGSNLGRRKKRKAGGDVQANPVDLPPADSDVTRAFDTQGGAKRVKPTAVDREFEATLKLAVQKISQAARLQKTHDVRQEYERLAAMQPAGAEGDFRAKRSHGIIEGSHEYIAYRQAMDAAEAIRAQANERQVQIDRHHAMTHRPEPSRPKKKKRDAFREFPTDIVDVTRGEIQRHGKGPTKKTRKEAQGQWMTPSVKEQTLIRGMRAPSAPPERGTTAGGGL